MISAPRNGTIIGESAPITLSVAEGVNGNWEPTGPGLPMDQNSPTSYGEKTTTGDWSFTARCTALTRFDTGEIVQCEAGICFYSADMETAYLYLLRQGTPSPGWDGWLSFYKIVGNEIYEHAGGYVGYDPNTDPVYLRVRHVATENRYYFEARIAGGEWLASGNDTHSDDGDFVYVGLVARNRVSFPAVSATFDSFSAEGVILGDNNSMLIFDEDQGELEEGNGYCHLINNARDNEVGATAHLKRDYTAASRCVFRLLCRRGEYLADPTIGSRFHTIKTIKADEALGICRAMAKEALKPLIDSGDIDSVSVDDVLHDPETGRLSVSLSIIAADDRVELGAFPLGSWR